MRRAGLFVLLLALAWPAGTRADDALAGWDQVRWGMTQADIDRVYGRRLRKPERPILYHQARVEAALPGVRIGGLPFVASFVLGLDGRLQQVLVDRRSGLVDGNLYAEVVADLVRQFGKPGRQCFDAGDPRGGSLVWEGPVTTVHALLFGYSSEALRVNPSEEIERPFYVPREEYRGMPTRPRILIRYHPTARRDLFGDRTRCRAPAG